MAHRAEAPRSIHRAMSACLLATSHQSRVPHPQKIFLKIFLDPVTCDRVRRKDLLYNRYRIGIVYPFLEKADGLLRVPFFPMEDLAMKRTIQSLSLSLLTALLFSGSVSAALPQLDPTDPAVQKVTDQASRMSETNQQVASYYQKSRYRTLDAVHSSEAKAEEGGLVFEVKEIRVTPSKFLSAEEIRRAIHFKGAGPATVKELTDMVARLNALYQEKHIVTAQAVLPPQKVQDGVVYIRLIEGKFGKTVVTGNQRISEKSLLSRIHGKTGELVDVDRLEDELRVYNSTNTYQVQAELVPGEEEGTSDLHLVLGEKENPLTSFIFTDNAGQKESGRYRIGAYTEYRGIGGHDASLAVSPVWTEGIWGGSVMYDTPWGHHGTRAQISYSRNLVDIIDGTFKDYDMKANSNDAAISITHPVNITPLSRVDVFLEGHRKWSDTTYSGMELSNSATRTVKAGLSARSFDENGLWFFMTSVTGYESDDRVNDKDNNGSYYSAYLMRRQNLKNDQYMLYRLYGQYTAFESLPSTEQFTLGGMGSVRGYKESILSGDKGWFAGMEYGFPISSDHQTWRGFVFLDHGVAYNNFSVKTTKDYLTSAGFGLECSKGGWYGKAVLGIPLKDSGNIGDASPRVHFYLQRNV